MTGVVLPIWTPAAGWLVLCVVAILIDSALVRRRNRRRGEARRLTALDALWLDEVGAGGESVAPSSSVSRGLTATTGADIYPWPRETILARTGQGDEAA